jgi:hypothetical protein
MCLRIGEERCEGSGRGVRGHHHHERRIADASDGGEILASVEGEIREQRHVGGEAVGRHQQRVPVRRGLGYGFHADVGARTRLVLHDDGLLEAFRQSLPDGARDDVHGATGCIRHHDVHGLRRILLRVKRRRYGETRE